MIDNKDCWLTGDCNKRDCNTFCMRLFKLDFLYSEALLNLKQRKHVKLLLDNQLTDKEAFTRLKNIENNIEEFVKSGKNLYIFSPICGNGKTSWCLRMIQSYFNKIWARSEMKCKALFIHVPTFLLALKDNISQKSDYIAHIKENVLDCDLVVWDEIGTKTSTVFESENLLSIINSRINAGKANIYTSNLDHQDLYDKLGERLYSRIINLSECIKLESFDKRYLENAQ